VQAVVVVAAAFVVVVVLVLVLVVVVVVVVVRWRSRGRVAGRLQLGGCTITYLQRLCLPLPQPGEAEPDRLVGEKQLLCTCLKARGPPC
jgi:hypothetical protein